MFPLHTPGSKAFERKEEKCDSDLNTEKVCSWGTHCFTEWQGVGGSWQGHAVSSSLLSRQLLSTWLKTAGGLFVWRLPSQPYCTYPAPTQGCLSHWRGARWVSPAPCQPPRHSYWTTYTSATRATSTRFLHRLPCSKAPRGTSAGFSLTVRDAAKHRKIDARPALRQTVKRPRSMDEKGRGR